jgi:hypothetical protein
VKLYLIKDIKKTFKYLFGCPLESSDNRILNFVEILDSLGAVHQDVGTVGVGTEAPDLTGLGDVVLVLIGQVAGTVLEVVTWVDFSLS